MMQRTSLLLFFALLIVFSCQFCSLESLGASSSRGWYFDRVNGIGSETVYACPNGVKISYPGHDMQLLSLPPAWNVIWYNAKNRCKFEQTPQEFERSRVFDMTPQKLPREHATYAGVKASKMTAKLKRPVEASSGWLLPRVGGRKVFVTALDFYVSDDLALPKGAIAMLSAYYNAPNYQGVPLALVEKLSDGTTRKRWFTKSIKSVVVPKAMLECPKDLRAMKTWQDLAATESGAQFDDMARGMKLGDPFGK